MKIPFNIKKMVYFKQTDSSPKKQIKISVKHSFLYEFSNLNMEVYSKVCFLNKINKKGVIIFRYALDKIKETWYTFYAQIIWQERNECGMNSYKVSLNNLKYKVKVLLTEDVLRGLEEGNGAGRCYSPCFKSDAGYDRSVQKKLAFLRALQIIL